MTTKTTNLIQVGGNAGKRIYPVDCTLSPPPQSNTRPSSRDPNVISNYGNALSPTYGSPATPDDLTLDHLDSIFTPECMQSFADAFPSKAALSKKILSDLTSSGTIRTMTARGTLKSPISPSMNQIRRPSALPTPAGHGHFKWQHINVFVGDKTDDIQILHNLTGEISSGQLMAVMGGSGAGMFRG